VLKRESKLGSLFADDRRSVRGMSPGSSERKLGLERDEGRRFCIEFRTLVTKENPSNGGVTSCWRLDGFDLTALAGSLGLGDRKAGCWESWKAW
jgi:hypothetical protein